MDGYQIIMKSDCKKGGGDTFFLKNKTNCQIVKLEINSVELLTVELKS